MAKNITLKQALAMPCKCGGMPALFNDETWMIYCQTCGKESISGVRRYYATNNWYFMNDPEKKKP